SASWFFAGLAVNQADPEVAIARYRRGIELNPDESGLWVNMGAVLYEMGRFDEALIAAQSALALSPGQALILVNLANAQSRCGDRDTAIENYRRALESEPRMAEAWTGLAIALDERGDETSAEDAYRRAVALQPDSARLLENYVAYLQERRRHDEALQLIKSAVQRRPGDLALQRLLGVALNTAGQAEEALAALRAAHQLDRYDTLTLLALSDAYRDVGEIERSIETLRELVAIDQDFKPAWANLGGMLFRSGDSRASVVASRRALAIDEAQPEVWFNLGNALLDDDLDEAERAWRRALELDSGHAMSRYSLGLVAERRGQDLTAIDHYRQATELDPTFAPAWFNLGRLSERHGDHLGAVEAISKLGQVRSDTACDLALLGEAYWNMGYAEPAMASFLRARELGENDPWLPANFGQVVDQCRREFEAIKDSLPRLQKFLEGGDQPVDPLEVRDLTRTALATGRALTAARWYRELFSRDPALLVGADVSHCLTAVRCAVAAGLGVGPEAEALDAEERAAWRRLAREWLDAWAAAGEAQIAQEPAAAATRARSGHALANDRALEMVRRPVPLAHLPEPEQLAWKR
ncbi:MAG: tetratricopeptide repeat protein, partial [Planctomycetes bacterium]|nr:tetratricopeptide repeat protein [Planctomycetota bacterium]